MKTEYPDYSKLRYSGKGVNYIRENLRGKNKKIFEDFISYCGVTAGKSKLVDYQLYFLQFIDIMQKPLDKLTPKDLTDYWTLLNQDAKRSVNTKNTIKGVIKRFVSWKYSNDNKIMMIMPKLTKKSILVNREKINKTTLLKPEELEALLRTASSLKEKAQVVSLYETGARPHELRNAKWKDIDFNKETLSLYSKKTSKPRQVIIKNSIVHLKRWKQEFCYPMVTDNDYIFPSPTDRAKPIGTWAFNYWISSLGKKAGIKRPIYCYLFRHSRITELYKKGVDELSRKAFAGHSENSKMQSIYVTMDEEDSMNEILNKIYNVSEITPKQKNEYKKAIGVLSNIALLLIEDKIKKKDKTKAKELEALAKALHAIDPEKLT